MGKVSMRTIKEVLRLKFESELGFKVIARACKISPSTVHDYCDRFEKAGLVYSKDLDDKVIDDLFFNKQVSIVKPLPNFELIHQELKRKHVTLMLLWQEYIDKNSDGYKYSYFCEHYKNWSQKLDPPMRMIHKAGEKVFVDYAGATIGIIDRKTGEIKEAQIFVGVLGASNYTYAESTWTQSLPDWIGSHIRMFEYFGGVPEIVVPDNLKSGVTSPCRYEPDINPTYNDLAIHYGIAIIPTRVRKPKDKAKVENGVQNVGQRILAKLRNRQFFSLEEANEAIWKELEILCNKPFQKLEGSRKSLFESLDKPSLRPLPQGRFESAEWKKAKVNIDYHIELDGNYYSVAYKHIHQSVDVRYTDMTVEIFLKNIRLYSHRRTYKKGQYITVKEHMPKSHQQYLEWTPSRIIDWAKKIGNNTSTLVENIMNSKLHPEQGYRSCLGIIRLEKNYGRDRVEGACKRAIRINGKSFKSVKSILENNLDKQELPIQQELKTIVHENIRGQNYYK